MLVRITVRTLAGLETVTLPATQLVVMTEAGAVVGVAGTVLGGTEIANIGEGEAFARVARKFQVDLNARAERPDFRKPDGLPGA